jgi:hypothetical protein
MTKTEKVFNCGKGVTVSKTQFSLFMAIRASGVCNMFDYRAISQITPLIPRGTHRAIVGNFDKLKVHWTE